MLQGVGFAAVIVLFHLSHKYRCVFFFLDLKINGVYRKGSAQAGKLCSCVGCSAALPDAGIQAGSFAPRLVTHPSDSPAVSSGGVGGEKVGSVPGEFTQQAFWGCLGHAAVRWEAVMRQGGRCVNAAGLESRARERCETAASPESG